MTTGLEKAARERWLRQPLSPLDLSLALATRDPEECKRARIDPARVTLKMRKEALAAAVPYVALPRDLAALRSFTKQQWAELKAPDVERYAQAVARHAILAEITPAERQLDAIEREIERRRTAAAPTGA